MNNRSGRSGGGAAALAAIVAALLQTTAYAGPGIQGQVVDLNGRALSQAMVTLTKPSGQIGPSAVTIFTDENGRFQLADAFENAVPSVKLLGHRVVDVILNKGSGTADWTIIMRTDANQANVAPASAWLAGIADPNDKADLVLNCVACHQIPAPEVRAYAKLMHDVPGASSDQAREQGWHAIVQYMNYLSAWEFGRGGEAPPPSASNVYSGGDAGPTAALLARTLKGPLQEISGYEYGAPLLVNARTVIREYEVPRPNAIREGLTLNNPRQLWLADVSANRVIRVDAETGALRAFEVPSKKLMGPHTLVRDKDGALWIAPFFNGIVARLEPDRRKWQTWELTTQEGDPVGVHDLTFDSNHDLVTDERGWIWYSDIVNNAVGWLDPKTGKSGVHRVPPVPGREGNEQLYGIVMTSDRTHVWYSQLGIGVFGCFNVKTQQFETVVQLPNKNAGPRRLAISDQDILYVPLYGSGQLVEYDTRARKILGTYDLPDRASAPYAVTWDHLRKVVWIPTSNANAIYRFDPRDKSFAVLPLPREGAFLRMLAVDKKTGALVTSYANIVENVHGPRMGVMIDLGDDVSRGGSR